MAAHRRQRRSSGLHDEAAHDNEERWLLTYADMITLLMTLFMVLFAISSVNTTKFDALSRALAQAFSGKIVTGGKSIQQTGATDHIEKATPEPPLPAIQPITSPDSTAAGPKASPSAAAAAAATAAANAEDQDFRRLKRAIDRYARAHGLAHALQTRITARGLVIRLLTDRVLFASGSATLDSSATPLLTKIAQLLDTERIHPIAVEGHTDSRPIASAVFPSNWELSTSRATSVVRFLIRHRVSPGRLQAAGYAAERPVQPNANPAGRARNRRVEIVLLRLNRGLAAGASSP